MLQNSFDILLFEEIDSTNNEAKRSVLENLAKDNQVIISKKQTAGRGRYGRSWLCEEDNLFLSLILQESFDSNISAQISFVAAVAVRSAFSRYAKSSNFGFKWPNDVLVSGKKISGILLERVLDKNQNAWVIVGVGANLNGTPKDGGVNAISLFDILGEKIDVQEFGNLFLDEFDKLYKSWKQNGFSGIRLKWLEAALMLGKKIKVNLASESFEAVFEDIDDQGRLVVRNAEELRLISSGEVFFEG